MSYEAWGDGDDGPNWRDDAMDHGWWDPSDISKAFKDVFLERERQVNVEGFTDQHDDQYSSPVLAVAAGCYLMFADSFPNPGQPPRSWPFPSSWWKPTDYRRDLVKAAALAIAEIERLDRKNQQAGEE